MTLTPRAERVPSETLRAVVEEVAPAARREMAVPSYTHANPFIRRLFWSRLDAAVRLAAPRDGETVLDFGVGSGVLLPTHHRRAPRVVGVDIELAPARAFARRAGLATELVAADEFGGWAAANRGAIDIVYALDCLEHLEPDELDRAGDAFATILSERGRLVVSGPTETFAYRIGRMVAGFKNEYHHTDITAIDPRLRRRFRREALVRLPPWPLPTGFWVLRYTAAAR